MPETSSFVQSLKDKSSAREKIALEQRSKREEELLLKHKDRLNELVSKWEPQICSALLRKAELGRSELHMNMTQEDFAIEDERPNVVCKAMLSIMAAGKLEGVRFDVWNNKAFTVHFSWGDEVDH